MGLGASLFVATSALLAASEAFEGDAAAPGLSWPSKGCQASPETNLTQQLDEARQAGSGWISLNVQEDIGVSTRWFFVHIPEGVGIVGKPAPMVMLLHGQYGQADKNAESHNLAALGEALKFITVFPQGVDDAPPENDQGTGWNVGTSGDPTVCVPEQVSRAEASSCYKSCGQRNQCGPCNWSTCHDDVLFIGHVLEAMAGSSCLDMGRLYVIGESNGGMMIHYLLQQYPGTFAAASPWFGLPLKGYGLPAGLSSLQATALRQTAMLAIHGRQDRVIPLQGGLGDGWYYVSLESEQAMWAEVHGCSHQPVPVKTRWDGGDMNLTCSEHKLCSSGRRVMTCLYDGRHAEYPDNLDDLVMWFFLQFRLDHRLVTRRGSQACFAEKAFCRLFGALPDTNPKLYELSAQAP